MGGCNLQLICILNLSDWSDDNVGDDHDEDNGNDGVVGEHDNVSDDDAAAAAADDDDEYVDNDDDHDDDDNGDINNTATLAGGPVSGGRRGKKSKLND